MNAQKANLINVVTLIFMSGWGYLDALTPSMSILVPMYFAIILLALNDGIKYDNKAQAYVAVVLSTVVIAILVNPLTAAMDEENHLATFRIGIMMLTTIVAMFYFIKGFISKRLAKQNKR